MSGPPPRRRVPLALPSILGLCLASATPAGAQVVISSQGRDNVVVNSDVLDTLGPPPGLPRLQLPNPAVGTAPSRTSPGERATPTESAPRSRIYALPPARTATPSAPAPAPTASLAPPPAAPRVSQAAPPPALAEPPPIPRSAAAALPTPSAPPPIPPIPAERPAPRVAVAPSAPPPPPALDSPAPPRPPAPPAAPVARAPAPAAPPPAAPAPAAPVVAAAAPAAAPPQVAAAAGVLSRVLFSAGSADISDTSRRELSQLADRLGRDSDSRIQLLAYADGTPESESQARRLSLSRALAVRSFLIDQGIRSTRVNVQALGIKATGGPADRVDALAVGP